MLEQILANCTCIIMGTAITSPKFAVESYSYRDNDYAKVFTTILMAPDKLSVIKVQLNERRHNRAFLNTCIY